MPLETNLQIRQKMIEQGDKPEQIEVIHGDFRVSYGQLRQMTKDIESFYGGNK